MRNHVWDAQGGHDLAKAPGLYPCTAGIQQALSKSTGNMTNGKRKRSVGQDESLQSISSPVTLPVSVTSSAAPRANAAIHTNPQSPPSFFQSATITDNGLTPPMSPVKRPNQHETPDQSPMPNPSLSTGRLEHLKQTLRTQIGLEILLKHNELRLIDQELAKCQIAYEQLRRCTEIPYHVSSEVGGSAGPRAHSNSSGPAPLSPAPWGVVDGPYSRHYAKWLLPDPTFDGVDETLVTTQHSEYARSTRGKPIEAYVTTAKRGYKSKAPLLPVVPKDKSGPMIIKRKSDGKWVKLKCLDCARDDFGSAQGFINHCRIQHHRSFTSHDAAAAACGEVVEVDPAGAVVGAPPIQPAALPRNGAVHPLIRSAHLIKPNLETIATTQETSAETQVQSQADHDTPPISANVSALASPVEFQASPHAPNLSAFIRDRGWGINVQDLVSDAKSTVPLPEADDSASEMDIDTPPVERFHGQHPLVAGSKQPTSPTQPRAGGKTSAFGQLRGGAVLPSVHTELHSEALDDLDLEPSPTNESNQAPSLVDDDEDDEYEGHSPTSSSESGNDDSEVDFHIEDEDHSGPSNLSPLYHDADKPQLGGLDPRPSAFRREFSNNKQEKHVSFVSPSPAREVSGRNSKRRKL